MTGRTAAIVFALLSVVALDACRKKVEPEPVPSGQGGSFDNAAVERRADSIANAAKRRQGDSLAAANANRVDRTADPVSVRADVMRVLTQKVYFEYDKDEIRDDARATLDSKAAALTANGSISLVINGHTDERGTAEYNLALGQRRAAQVKRYLSSKGVADGRMTTQSMGDSQPAAQGTDESAYAQNRRAEFEVQNAGGAMTRPRE